MIGKREVPFLGFGVATAVFVRAARISADPLSFDEGFSWRLTRLPFGELVRRTAADVHPPLYYLALKAWTGLAGDSVVALRLPSLALSCLAVPFVYLACREFVSLGIGRDPAGSPRLAPAAAGVAALLAAVNAQQVAMGHYARMYALGVALTACSVWCVSRAAAGRPRGASLGFLVCGILSLYTHNYLIFSVGAGFAALSLLAVARGGLRGAGARSAWWAGAGLAVGYAPWLSVLRWQVRDVQADYWIVPPDPRVLASDLALWSVGARNLDGVELGLVAVLLALLMASSVLRFGRLALIPLALAAAPWLGCLAGSWSVGRSLYQARYLTFAQVPFLVWLGVAIASVPGRVARPILAAALLGLSVNGLHAGHWQTPAGSPAVVAAVSDLARSIRPGDLIVVPSPADRNLVDYYAGKAGIANPVVSETSRRDWSPGHVAHAASLGPGDGLEDHDLSDPAGRRIWALSESSHPEVHTYGGFRHARTTTSEAAGGARLYLRRFDPRPQQAPAEGPSTEGGPAR